MRTPAEMHARLAAQEAHRKTEVERRVVHLTGLWIAALQERIDSAYDKEFPVSSVHVASHYFADSDRGPSSYPFEDVVKLAAERAVNHFISQKGYNSWTYLSNGVSSVNVSWDGSWD